MRRRPISEFLSRAPAPLFVSYAVVVAFATYFCMYAFRKPFAAARFEGLSFFGTEVELKTALVISQIVGYALSKFIGIKVCSEASGSRRAWLLVWLILWAETALLAFAIVPASWRIVPIFLNGLPLGIQLSSSWQEDDRLLAVAHWVNQYAGLDSTAR